MFILDTTLFSIRTRRSGNKVDDRVLGRVGRDCRKADTSGTLHGTVNDGSVHGLTLGRSGVAKLSACFSVGMSSGKVASRGSSKHY